MNQQTNILELGKRIVAQITEFRRCALKPITSEKTDKQGLIILALSSILILLFTHTIRVKCHEILGTHIDFIKGRESFFLIILIIVWLYFSALYWINLWLDLTNWKMDYSEEKHKINKLMNELQALKTENGQRLYDSWDDALTGLKRLDERDEINNVGKAVEYYRNAARKENTILYRLRIFLLGAIPIVFVFGMLLTAVFHYMNMI